MAFDGQNFNQGSYDDDEFEFIETDDSNELHVDDIELNYDQDNDDELDNENNDYNDDSNKNSHKDNNDTQDDQPKDLISEFLKTKGIVDRNSIKYENDEGEIEEYSFDDLSLEEQLEILGYTSNESEIQNNLELTEDDKSFFEHLKENNISISDYLEYYKQSVIEELQSNSEISEIDSLSSDEIFLYDLKQRFPDFTEEELLEEVNLAKSREEVFEKKVSGLREHYKKLEEEFKEQQAQRDLEKSREDSEKVQNQILEASRSINQIGVMELEDSDIQSALDVIFTQDDNGNTALNKALNDPKLLVEIAWFISKGKESIESLADYYRGIIKEKDGEIKKVSKQSKTNGTVVVKDNKTTKKNQGKREFSIDDIEY